MEKTFLRIFFVLFATLWGALIVLNAVKRPTAFSENESRMLTAFPSFSWKSFVEGGYMRQVDDYCSDQFFGRDAWITVHSTSEFLLGKRESNKVFIGKHALLQKSDPPSEKVVAENVQAIEQFSAASGLTSYLMLVPSAAAVQPEMLPPFAPVWDESGLIEPVFAGLQSTTGVDVFSALRAQREKQLYYRTDHHWTTYGAYLAYTRFCEAAGFAAAPYTARTVSDAFNGTLYSKSGVRFVQSDTMEAFETPFDGGCDVLEGDKTAHFPSVYFADYLQKKDQYAYFLGPNKAVVTLYGTAGTGRQLLMFKDSYAHCMAPMLLAHYDKITLVDLRYVNTSLSHLFDVRDYDAVLHLYSTDVFTHESTSYKLLRP